MDRLPVAVIVDVDERDQEDLDEFWRRFGDAAAFQRLEPGDGASGDSELTASTNVTMVLNGLCTFRRAHVDAAVHASLETRQEDGFANGLLIVIIDRNAQKQQLSDRLEANVESGYSRLYRLPLTTEELRHWIEEAVRRRSECAASIRNDLPVMSEDSDTEPFFSPFLKDGRPTRP